MSRHLFTSDLSNYILEQEMELKKRKKEEEERQKKIENEHTSILDTLNIRKANKEKLNEFTENLTGFLLLETFQRIFDKCMKDSIFDNEEINVKEFSKSLLANYINEENSYSILRTMRSGGLLLTELAKNIDKTSEAITKKIDLDDESTLSADRVDMDNFYQTLDMTDFDDVTNLIQTRVSLAAERFTERNYNDKIDLQDAATKTEERINNLKKGIRQSDEDLESMKEDAKIYYKKVHNRILNRTKSLYEQMVYTLAESTMRNDKLKKEFTIDGRLNMEKIEESVKCMYTLLEMVNTLKISNINKQYIEKVLKDLSE